MTGGCIFVSASTEFSDRPGKVRDFIRAQQETLVDSLRRIAGSAVRAGEFGEGTDCDQFAFDLYSLMLGFHYYDRLLDHKDTRKHQEVALERLLADYA